MTMKKNTLLIAVAAAALAVGSGTAFSQSAPQGGQKSESPAAAPTNPASKNAPAEKIQGGAGHKAETNGQGATQNQKMGQDQKGPNKSTTGQAPSEPKAGQANERRDNKMGEERNKNNRSTTGQAPAQQQTTPNTNRSNEPNRMNSGQTNERGGANVNERGANERGGAGGAGVNERGAAENRGGSTNVNVNLTTEQRTKIHSIIVADRSAPRIAHADFDVRVGVVVPRDKVKFVAVPSTIVEIQPAWRGFEYFLVGDEIVIVDPATLRIVAVIPA
jgi:hypothetical protein